MCSPPKNKVSIRRKAYNFVFCNINMTLSTDNFQGEVTDPDESQQFIFTRTRSNFNYDPSNLQSAIAVEEPIKVYNSGEVKSEITFNDDMKVCALALIYTLKSPIVPFL